MKYVLIILLIIVIFIILITFSVHKNLKFTFNYQLVKSKFQILILQTSLFTINPVTGCIIYNLYWLYSLTVLVQAKRKLKWLEQQLAPVKAVSYIHTSFFSFFAPKE